MTFLRKYDFYDLAKSFSKKSKKYNDLTFQDDYNNKTSFVNYNIGTLHYYSKENKTNYDKIKKKYLKKENILKLQNEYEKMEIDFNKTHFKVINKSLYCKINYNINDLIVMKKQTLIDSYSHLKYIGVDSEGNKEDKSSPMKLIISNRHTVGNFSMVCTRNPLETDHSSTLFHFGKSLLTSEAARLSFDPLRLGLSVGL